MKWGVSLRVVFYFAMNLKNGEAKMKLSEFQLKDQYHYISIL